MKPCNHRGKTCRAVALAILGLLWTALPASGETVRLESQAAIVQVDTTTGQWSLTDKAAGVRWPSEGTAGPGSAKSLESPLAKKAATPQSVRLEDRGGRAVVLELTNGGRSLVIRYEGKDLDDIRLLGDVLTVNATEHGAVIAPCREGLWIPADSGVAFKRTFGASDYEGCHMNMLGFLKSGVALVADWDDFYVFPEVESRLKQGSSSVQRISTTFLLRRSARSVRLTPLGKGDWNTVAAGYRRIAEAKGLAVTLRDKVRRNAHAERMLGAANVKLWTCLARRMNEDSTKEESVTVRWTFDEAAAIAEHLQKDLGIDRCLFTIGGWTEGGYDCRHPDNLPANPECGGNKALADAIRRIQSLGYVASLHDNYQDMYHDAKSWNPDFIEKKPDGSIIRGGRWLGGRAYMVCAPKQVELAMRPQNLPEIQKLFGPWSYFIDTTYAVGPRECADPKHTIGRNEDVAFKSQLSDKARELFGLFGSECGREWALPHSDFFEGLVGVSGRHFHNLKAESLGATAIPFWEMVYHDCQVCYGKYGYSANQAADYVAHHVLCARPLHYHSMPDHLYWKQPATGDAKPKHDGKTPFDASRTGFTRTDQGWAEGFHPIDAFLKTTQEVLGPLNLATAYDRLTRLEFLTPDGSVRRAVYGEGDGATCVTVNFGESDATVDSKLGGKVLLPAWGFVIDAPRFAAFYAKRWNGRDYPNAAMFTLHCVEGKSLRQASRLRIFHGFGDPKIAWRGAVCEVRREQVVIVSPGGQP